MYSKTDSGMGPVDLSMFDEEFERAAIQHAPEVQTGEIPDGFYDTRIEDVTLGRTLNTGNAMVVWKLRILGPQQAGRSISKVRVITAKTLAYLKEDLKRLGVDLTRLSELPSRTDEMVDKEIGIFKKTNADRRWSEVYFTRTAPHREQSDIPEPAWAGTDDDLPF